MGQCDSILRYRCTFDTRCIYNIKIQYHNFDSFNVIRKNNHRIYRQVSMIQFHTVLNQGVVVYVAEMQSWFYSCSASDH